MEEQEVVEILPCPNCEKIPKVEPSPYVNHFAFSVVCVCGTSSRYAMTEAKAIKIWNTRPIEDRLQKQIDSLKITLADKIEWLDAWKASHRLLHQECVELSAELEASCNGSKVLEDAVHNLQTTIKVMRGKL